MSGAGWGLAVHSPHPAWAACPVSGWRDQLGAALQGILSGPAQGLHWTGNSCDFPLEAELLATPDQIRDLVQVVGKPGCPGDSAPPALGSASCLSRALAFWHPVPGCHRVSHIPFLPQSVQLVSNQLSEQGCGWGLSGLQLGPLGHRMESSLALGPSLPALLPSCQLQPSELANSSWLPDLAPNGGPEEPGGASLGTF